MFANVPVTQEMIPTSRTAVSYHRTVMPDTVYTGPMVCSVHPVARVVSHSFSPLDGSPAASTLSLGDGSGDPAYDQYRAAVYGDDATDDVSHHVCWQLYPSLTFAHPNAVPQMGRLDLCSEHRRQCKTIYPRGGRGRTLFRQARLVSQMDLACRAQATGTQKDAFRCPTWWQWVLANALLLSCTVLI